MSMKLIFLYFGSLLLLIAGCIIVDGDPTITDYNNSVDTNNLYPNVPYDSLIIFNATANETITTWTWYSGGVDQSHNFDSYTTSWTSIGYKNVSVTATNGNGTSNMITWNPYISMEMSGGSDVVAHMDESGFDNIMAGINGTNPDFELLLWGATEPFQVAVGNAFFLVLFGIPMIMFYIRQNTILLPSLFGIIIGTVMFSFLPASFAYTANAIIVMAVLAVLYSFYKERR